MPELTSGINKLIDRIKSEGVQAGEAEQNRLVTAAHQEAERILADARKEAEKLRAEAEREATQLRQRTEADLRLAVRDFVAAFQERIRAHLIKPVISERAAKTLEDPEFLTHTLEGICKAYVQSGGDGGIEATVSPETAEALGAYFSRATSEKLAGVSELKLTAQKGLTGFRLKREAEGFTWDFTLDAIVSELAELVDPALKPYFELSGH
jgi:V/A-type H+-transporting ATPase subunit E